MAHSHSHAGHSHGHNHAHGHGHHHHHPADFGRAFAIGIILNLGFVVVAVIFVSATLLDFASHSPGGLGVFDAAMLVGLWPMDREDLLAGMLLFRVLYYLAPFVISVILLTLREVILGARLKRLRRMAPGLEVKPKREPAYLKERRDAGA